MCPRKQCFVSFAFHASSAPPPPPPQPTKCSALGLPTSRDETDGTEEACLCVVHLDGQQLVGKSEHQVSEWAKTCIVHLCPVEGQPVREGHGVLVGGVPCTDAQDLTGRENRQREEKPAIYLRLPKICSHERLVRKMNVVNQSQLRKKTTTSFPQLYYMLFKAKAKAGTLSTFTTNVIS